ncbi:methylenetetrahydrofolate reductase, partial [Chloroflexota bacterium]
MKAGTNLEKVLEDGNFAVTAEVGPPKGASANAVQKKCEVVKSCSDAINVTDNQTAVVRMSSTAGAVLLKQMGADPVMQMTCRDRNRIAIQ